MARRLLPALRRDSGLEQKSLTIQGGRYGGITPATRTLGMTDRSAGWDLDAVIADGYERVVWVFKAVEVISGNASRLPFKITSGENEEVEDHPLLRVLNKQANPSETGRAFRKRLSAQILLSKRGAFVEVTKSRGGQITRLDLLPPDRVRVVPDPGGDYVDYFEFTRYDGQVRDIPPERIRWIREPHPLDPFSGTTPLEPAGMSVELDSLAREYNVSFIKRDGRPGGILGVDADGLEEDELDRITMRMKAGPEYAGQITAIGTGPGGMNYIDTASRPRDMAYETTSEKSKKEILASFGVPESLAGDASGRTFDNAEQEEYNFWHDPMLPHLELIASAFDGDVDEDLDCTFDTSKVEALEIPARRRREERRKEWNDGLITIKEYREGAEYEDIDNAHTRALWISPAKAPVPGRPGDEAALGLGDGGGDMGMGGGQQPPGPAAPQPGQTAADAVAAAIEQGGVIDPDATPEEVSAAGAAHDAVDAARAGNGDEPDPGIGLGDEARAAVEAARMEGKALTVESFPDAPVVQTYDPGDEEQRRVEMAVAAALDAMLARQAGVVAARMESPKLRRGTRYWLPDGDTDERVGDAPIDTARAVDAARWSGELQETLQPIVQPAAQSASQDLLAALAATGVLTAGVGASAVVAGRAAPVATAEQVTQAAAQAAVAPAMLALAIAQEAMETWLDERVIEIDRLMVEQSPDLPELIMAVKKVWADRSRAFSDSLAVTLSQTAVSGGREAAGAVVAPAPSTTPAGDGQMVEHVSVIDRAWVTRDDERVRASHEEAAGQRRAVGDPFDVGGYDVRYPSDPLAPPSVARWCRCWLRYEWAEDARFTLGSSG